jgi:hypothetical protein
MPGMSVLDNIPKVRFHEPELNLPGRLRGLLNAEEWFTIQFAQAYEEKWRHRLYFPFF